MIHNILPTQQSVNSLLCTLCNTQNICDLSHALLTCSYNAEVSTWLITTLSRVIPGVNPEQVTLLNMKADRKLDIPLTWLIAQTLETIWNCRLEKKSCTLSLTRDKIERTSCFSGKLYLRKLLNQSRS